jgi:hypothetical protein
MKRVGWTVAVGALTAAAWPAQGSAVQQQQNEAECRCVDADGEPIDDCTCFRMPRLDMAFAPFGARPRLGISVSTDQEGTVDAQGARVTSVLDDGPAAEAGLQEGDIITRVGGQSLLQPLDADVEEDFDLDVSLPVQRLLSIARGLEAGEQVEIEYLRGGERLTATVEAQELSARSFAYAYGFDPERIRVDAERLREQARAMAESARAWEFQWRGPDAPRPPGAPEVGFFGGGGLIGPLGSSRYGLELIELNEGLGTYFGASEGVLVTEVDEDSTLGLRAGDVILRVGDRDVDTPDRVLRLLGTYEDGEEVTFRIRRNGSEMSVMGRLGR